MTGSPSSRGRARSSIAASWSRPISRPVGPDALGDQPGVPAGRRWCNRPRSRPAAGRAGATTSAAQHGNVPRSGAGDIRRPGKGVKADCRGGENDRPGGFAETYSRAHAHRHPHRRRPPSPSRTSATARRSSSAASPSTASRCSNVDVDVETRAGKRAPRLRLDAAGQRLVVPVAAAELRRDARRHEGARRARRATSRAACTEVGHPDRPDLRAGAAVPQGGRRR